MDAIFPGLGLFRESIFICPTYPKFMGVPPGLPVHVLDGHSNHLDFPNAFQYFLPTKTQARLGSWEPFSQNKNDHSI